NFNKVDKCISKLSANIGNNQIKLAGLVAAKCYDEKFKENHDSQHHLFHFRNLTVDLKTGKSRKRTPKDFVTQILDYDYSEERNPALMQQVLKIYCNIFNDE